MFALIILPSSMMTVSLQAEQFAVRHEGLRLAKPIADASSPGKPVSLRPALGGH